MNVQSSLVSAERLFGGAGYQEGFRRHHGKSSVTEMLLMIRSFGHLRIDSVPKKQGFLNSRAQAMKNLAEETAGKIEPD